MRRRLAPLLPGAAVCVALAAVLLPAPGGGGDPGPQLAVTAAGKLFSNSNEGEPILTASGMAPGAGAEGTVKVALLSRDPVRVKLVPRNLRDTPGALGGELSEALRLRVERLRGEKAPEKVYGGSLAEVEPVAVGRWERGTARRYRFTIRLPDRGTPSSPFAGDNLYQDSTARLDFVWKPA